MRPVSLWKGRDIEVRDIAFHITPVCDITAAQSYFFIILSIELQQENNGMPWWVIIFHPTFGSVTNEYANRL